MDASSESVPGSLDLHRVFTFDFFHISLRTSGQVILLPNHVLSFALIHRRLVEFCHEQRENVGRIRRRRFIRLVERVVCYIPILLGFTNGRFRFNAARYLAQHSDRAGLVDLGYQQTAHAIMADKNALSRIQSVDSNTNHI